MKKEKKRKIRMIKSYTIKLTEYDDDTTLLEKISDGFNPIEIIGLLEFVKKENINNITDRKQ